ncbi:MAG: GerW family sporulation protein [Christensenellales bacterium]
MQAHPIENIMQTTMENIKGMIDVNTIVGSPVITQQGDVIIPISKVSFGFVSGGGEYNSTPRPQTKNHNEMDFSENAYPFAGGSGAGISLNPMAFLVLHGDDVKLLPVNYNTIYDRVVESVPRVMEELKELFKRERKTNVTVQ